MSFTPGQGATVSMNVDGAAASVRDVETVGDALRKLNDRSLKDVNSELGELKGGVDSVKTGIGDVVATVTAGLSVGMFVAMVKESIDAADGLNDLSKSTRIAVADLAGLRFASSTAGGDLDSVADSINKLSVNIGKNAEKFAKLGVTAKDPLEAYKQFADVYKSISDPQLQASLAAEAVGKSWAGSAPLLAEGGKRIGELVEKGKAMSGMTQEMADKADEFNDRMAELTGTVDGFKTKLASDMLPGLIDITGALKDAYEESGLLNTAWRALGAAGTFVFTDEFKSHTVKIANLKKELSDLETDLSLSKNSPAFGYLGRLVRGDTTENLTERVNNTKAAILSLQNQMAAANAPKPVVNTKAAAKEAEAEAKAAREAEAKAAAFLKLNEDARRKASAAIDKEAAAYGGLTSSIKERIAAASREAEGLAPLTESQKLQISLTEKLASGQLVLTATHKTAYEARIKELGVAEVAAKQATAKTKAQAEFAATAAKAVSEADAEASANEELVRTYGMSKAAIEQLTIARMEEDVAQLRFFTNADAEIAKRESIIAAKKRSAAALASLDTLEKNTDVAQARELLEVMSAIDAAARDAAAGMSASFGSVGAAIGGLTTAMTGYGRTQAAIAAQLKLSTKDAGGDTTKIAKANAEAARASAQAQVQSYGNMASAAKGFFKENTTGYKVMEGAEKAFRAAEMAMALQSMIKKTFFKEGEVAANLSLNAAKLAGEAGTTAASTGLAATEASAWGITAVVKAMASLPFPLNLAAGAATLAAVVAVGAKIMGGGAGGGAATTFEDRQKAQGTGTVLGDDTAKSQSIADSLDRMEKYASLELDYQNSMLAALRNIESALGGAAKNVLQTVGITGGSAFGTQNSSSQSFFGSDKSTTITDSGLKFAGSFGSLRNGTASGIQYEDVTRTTDGGWFGRDKTSNNTNTKALAADAMKPFSLIFNSMGDLLVDAGVKLGKDGGQLAAAINAIPVDFAVSLRGLKGQDLADAIGAGVSVAFDKVTTQMFPQIAQFQKVGEGLGDTLVRVAADVQAVDSVFAAMGKAASTVILGTTETFGDTLRAGLSALGPMSMEAKERLVEAAGGLDKFATSASSFMKNFYSEEDQRAASKARLAPLLATVGLSTEGAGAQKMFKDFVLGLDTSTAAGAKTYAMLMDVQQAFKDVTDAAAGERKDLQDQLDELTMTSTQLLRKQRQAFDPSNRALFDQIQVLKAQREAQDSTRTSLQDVIAGMQSFGKSARSLRDSLLLGNLTTLTPEQQYAETKRQYERTIAAARGGDADAQANFASIQSAFLSISQKVNGADAKYSADFAAALRTSDEMALWADQQVDVAKASLEALTAQVTGIGDLNNTMNLVVQGITDLSTSLSTAPSFANPLDFAKYGGPGADALVAEINALRQEVKGLRADAGLHAGAQMASNSLITLKAAETVVAGVHDADRSSDWKARNTKVALL